MIGTHGEEGGFSLVEMLVVLVILSIVMGGIVSLFTAGINAESDQNRRYQAQQDGRLALDKLRREIHGACKGSAATGSLVQLYFTSDSCISGAHTVTYCTTGSSSRYALNRIGSAAATCTGTLQKVADYLTGGAIFTYLLQNSPANSYTLPRLHIDMTLNQNINKPGAYHLVDDIALRNGPRS